MTSRRKLALQFFEILDYFVMAGAFVFAIWTEHLNAGAASFAEVLSIRLKLVNVLIVIGIFLAWRGVFRWLGLYRSHRLSSLPLEMLESIKATSLSALILINAAFILDLEFVSARFVGTFWLASTLGVVLLRVFVRVFLRRARRSGRNLSRVLIVGTNSRALDFAHRLRSQPHLGYIVEGFADNQWPGLEELDRRGETLKCSLSELPQYLRETIVDEVVIALPMSSAYSSAADIVRMCEEQGIIIRFLPDLFNLSLASAEVTNFEGQPLISLRSGAIRGRKVYVKRALDIGISFSLLLLMMPILLIVALSIKLTSRGGVFFVQQRVGLNKRIFPLLKFRTMVEDAESQQAEIEHLNESEGPVFKIVDDPRITPLGRFLRRASLDELPQLINVLVGHMSLVGPRPLPVRDYEGFGQDWHRRRFSVRPGITCLWQVSGRSSIPFERWMELDMMYIDEWSLALDMRILARTIPAVLKGQGAA